MNLSSAQVVSLVVLVALAAIVARRTFGMVQGTVVSVARLAGIAAVFVALWLLVVAGSIPTPPWYSIALDAAAVVATVLLARPYVERRVVLEARPDGQWYYRLPGVVPAVYLVLFIVRISVQVLVVGTTPFGGPSSVTLTPLQSTVLYTVDALFSVSVGLLVARSWGVYRRYRSGPPAAGPSPG